MNKDILQTLMLETARQHKNIELIASENFASDDVMKLCGSLFTNKYAEGYPGKRYYNGCDNMDKIERIAIEQLTKLYHCNYANVQPHSGANANIAVYQAFLNPGDKILGMDLTSGGHLTHGATVNFSGKVYESHTYSVNKHGWLDYDEIESRAREVQPKMIVAGASAYSRVIDFSRFRKIADSVGAYLLVDMAHYSGLIAGGAYPNPVEYADVVTSTTHKTLRGPRGGIILWNNPDYTNRINSAVFPGTQGGPLMNIVAAKAQAFSEALEPQFKQYAADVVANAQALSDVLTERGYKVITGGTDSHIVLVDLTKQQISGREAADKLEEKGVTVNKNSIPVDCDGIPTDPKGVLETSGIRIGTAAETTRGKGVEWFKTLAHDIAKILEA